MIQTTSIRNRLNINIMIPILLMLVIAAIGVLTNLNIRTKFNQVAYETLRTIEALEEVKYNTSRLISSTNEFILDAVVGIEEGDADEENEAGEGEADEENEASETGDEDDEDDEDDEASELEEIADAIADLQAQIAAHRAVIVEFDVAELPINDALNTEVQTLITASQALVAMQETNAPVNEIGEAREEYEEIEEAILVIVAGALADERAELLKRELDVSNAVNTALAATLGIGVAAIVIAGLRSYTVNQSIFNPLTELRDTAEKLRSGDLKQRAKVRSADEIGEVAFSFNIMVDAIQQRQLALNDLNQSLEQRIEERTAELSASRDEAVALQKLAQDNARLKSEFLSTMSHELRTPLNAIEGFTSIMLAGMGIELSPRAEDMIKRVSINSKRLLALVNDFLDLSRIEAGRLDLVKMPISPEALAHKWENQVGILAENKNIEFVVTVDPNLPPTILGDEDALSKIAINLLGNAFKFTQHGRVTLDLKKDTTNWLLMVTDTGIGIPMHARDYIFDEFRQVDSSSKRLYGGTGLGLALVKKLARAMGGTVSLESEIGKGSTFIVVLPLETSEKFEEVAIL
jgi:signal transduction histidine kinase